jgi:hypothetical protein
MNNSFKLLRIGMPEQTITKMVTNGARIKALICLKASKPNKTNAKTNTKIPKFIAIAPLRLYYILKKGDGFLFSIPHVMARGKYIC